MRSTAERHRALLTCYLITALLLAYGGRCGQQLIAQEAAAEDWTAYKIEPPFAWDRSDRYERPNFEAFFPDDAEAGKQLDLMLEGKLNVASVDERLARIRRGLRHTSHYRTNLLGSVGNQFIWNREQQDPRAIELMYHASAASDGGIAHYALYHGPTVVSQRTPNLVRMLMEHYQLLDRGMQQRIAWGMKTYGDRDQTRQLLLALLDQYKTLDPAAVGGTLDVYQAVFGTSPPDMERFDDVGTWVIAFHRSDLSADHPWAAEILQKTLDQPLRNREQRLIDFVTRVDEGHEAAVALVQGMGVRADVTAYLSQRVDCRIDFNEMLSARILQECRLREFARYLPDGLPTRALPGYTRPPANASYAHLAEEFIAPTFEEFFADDPAAAAQLDQVYDARESIELSDRELLDLFRRGVRRSAHSPNTMFGWIAGSLGWPRDPLLTEILYQAMDPDAPLEVRKAGIYYGFGLGTSKTKNILEAMYRVYMAPPFDSTTNRNMRSRILWGVRDHEDDKYYLATRFEQVLRDHASISDEALRQADIAYRQLTDREPANSAEYASRSVYLVVFQDKDTQSVDEAKQRIERRLGDSPHVIDTKYLEDGGQITVLAVVQGSAGMKWLVDNLQAEPKLPVFVADLLTPDLIQQAENDILKEFEKHLPPPR
jgi:hypothetical protein